VSLASQPYATDVEAAERSMRALLGFSMLLAIVTTLAMLHYVPNPYRSEALLLVVPIVGNRERRPEGDPR
jgi:hypothetical protein